MFGKSLPPLHTLRAVEAAVRHSSFTRAAEELALTQGAISQQVRNLELAMGKSLFVRETVGVTPTPDAQAIALQIRQALRLLDRGLKEHLGKARRGDPGEQSSTTLRISALSAFASRWLLPRLGGFLAEHPRILIDLKADAGLARLDASDGVDMALRYGPGGWKDLESEAFMTERLFPVARGDIVGPAPATPQDLVSMPLIWHGGQPWEPWFQAARLSPPDASGRLTVDDSGMLIDAAVAGLGVALVRASLVERELADGRLDRLTNLAISDVHSHFVVWRSGSPKQGAINAFRAWLHTQAEGMVPLDDLDGVVMARPVGSCP